ncbi:solute carrier organic anion transporter family member 1C1-like [Danio aesculapii]|uniref:solute carrier organic anion transporter family member 1C1-like n=1 Tax=Danio aesculapii TaxID=1142201 RepID=UPI0024BFE123|nr:solute carrier organic anion transporter family member 1C1-like [Danio aesculapii]
MEVNPNGMEYSDRNEKTSQTKCCSPNLKIFIGALAFCYFSKTLTVSYTKSAITQIERRFEIPSSTVGIIDGSFEMGNMLVITLVSYIGAKFHRPKIIGAGVLLMGIGTLLMASPHFIMDRYKYDTAATHTNDADNFTVISTCSSDSQETLQQPFSGCQTEEAESSPLWVIVFLGNSMRGIGEASIVPLGMSFIDDYARPENSAFYIGCLNTVKGIGPFFGFMLGSLCANLYVDIGLVNKESVTITPQDSRWVGAWWLGYVVSGLLTLLAAFPFWFLPKVLPENSQISLLNNTPQQHKTPPSLTEIVKDFAPTFKRLLTNKIYILYLMYSIVAYNDFVIVVTYTPKYLEQQFGQSASKTNFLIGVTCVPAMALGIFLSGLMMKRFKWGLLASARMNLFTNVAIMLLSIPFFTLSCENLDIAGVTVPYQGSTEVQDIISDVPPSCNADCGCPDLLWDPVCGENGVTYISPCHAGCNSTQGAGRNMTFHDCSCIQSWGLSIGNSSAVLGQCSQDPNCNRMIYIYLGLLSLSFFVYSLGTVPFLTMSLRIVDPELKSLSVGMLLLSVRVLGGIPAPFYFGALIDYTCLKWGQNKSCGRGACRVYDIETFRFLFQGLTNCLRVLACSLLWIATIGIKRKMQNDKHKDTELQRGPSDDPEHEDTLIYWTTEQTIGKPSMTKKDPTSQQSRKAGTPQIHYLILWTSRFLGMSTSIQTFPTVGASAIAQVVPLVRALSKCHAIAPSVFHEEITSPWMDLAVLQASVPLEQVSRHGVGSTEHGLGSHVLRACSCGSLERNPAALAYQLPRAVGSVSPSPPFFTGEREETRAG